MKRRKAIVELLRCAADRVGYVHNPLQDAADRLRSGATVVDLACAWWNSVGPLPIVCTNDVRQWSLLEAAQRLEETDA